MQGIVCEGSGVGRMQAMRGIGGASVEGVCCTRPLGLARMKERLAAWAVRRAEAAEAGR